MGHFLLLESISQEHIEKETKLLYPVLLHAKYEQNQKWWVPILVQTLSNCQICFGTNLYIIHQILVKAIFRNGKTNRNRRLQIVRQTNPSDVFKNGAVTEFCSSHNKWRIENMNKKIDEIAPFQKEIQNYMFRDLIQLQSINISIRWILLSY